MYYLASWLALVPMRSNTSLLLRAWAALRMFSSPSRATVTTLISATLRRVQTRGEKEAEEGGNGGGE